MGADLILGLLGHLNDKIPGLDEVSIIEGPHTGFHSPESCSPGDHDFQFTGSFDFTNIHQYTLCYCDTKSVRISVTANQNGNTKLPQYSVALDKSGSKEETIRIKGPVAQVIKWVKFTIFSAPNVGLWCTLFIPQALSIDT